MSDGGTLVSQGNANAAYQYSLMYIDGIGVPMDYKQAVYWMERSVCPGLFCGNCDYLNSSETLCF